MRLRDLLYSAEFGFSDPSYGEDLPDWLDEPLVIADPISGVIVAVIPRAPRPGAASRRDTVRRSWKTRVTRWLATATSGMLYSPR